MDILSPPLPHGFSTLHDIMRSDAALREFSDNLAGDKRLIALIISVLQQTIAARSYKKTYNLAGEKWAIYSRNVLSVNMLIGLSDATLPAR